MTAKVNLIHTKDKNSDSGFVFVNFKLKGLPGKRVSTKIKVTRKQFDDYRNKDLPIFNQTSDKNFDADALNKKILEITSAGAAKKPDAGDFISFFENKLHELDSGATYEVYTNTLNKLKKYYTTIPFEKIDDNFMRDFKSKLIKEGISDGQIKYNFTVLNNYISQAREDLDVKISVNIGKLKLKNSHRGKDNLLDDADVVKLIDYKFDFDNQTLKKRKEFAYISLGLCQLFGCGARFSDIIFLRWSDFKKDNIQIQTTKTKIFKTIPYSIMLLKTLWKYMHRDFRYVLVELENMEKFGHFEANSQMLLWLAGEVVKHAKSQPQDEFIFKEIINAGLFDYYTSKPFNREQYRLMRNIRSNYNIYLRNFSITYKFQHELSSHGFRYRFVANQLDANTPIHIISKFLGHTSITTTEAYISRNYEKAGTKELLNVADDKYINRQEN
jgi:integrase